MYRPSFQNRLLTYCIATVWLLNGLACKVLNLVPRHQQIVAAILGNTYSRQLTLLIGILEIGMAIWIWSCLWSRFNAIAQIAIIATMNILEFILVPELLLWGKANAFFALLLILIIYYNDFYLQKQIAVNA
jgi:hypothetical protein